MLRLEIDALPASSACAAVARSSATLPDFVLAGHRSAGLIVARWRRRSARLAEPQCLDDHLLSYSALGGADSFVMVDGDSLRVRQVARTVSFVPAGRSVQWRLTSTTPVEHVHLYIPADAMRLHSDLGPHHKQLRALANLHDPWLDGFFRLMLAEVDECQRAARLADSTFLDSIGDLLLRHVSALLEAAPGEPSAQVPADPGVSPLRPYLLRRIEVFVRDRLATNIPVAQLAALAGMSVGHFVRAFRQATGSTPHQYLLEQRLDAACALLRETTLPVAVVARRCGFGAVAHFSTTFHRHRGLAPSQFRQLQ